METNINFAVIVPWRPKPDRRYAFNIIQKWYRDNLNVSVIPVDDGKKPFCLAGCRNLGVKMAEEQGYDVVVINDADTIPEKDPLLEAISLAMTNASVYLPYTEYRSLMNIGTSDFMSGSNLRDCRHLVVPGACSGIYVTSPKTWWAHYGQDERFQGWGFEDAAWWSAHKVLLGREPSRVDGCVFSLHHNSEKKHGVQYSKNATLCAHYHKSENNVDEMRLLAAGGLGQ